VAAPIQECRDRFDPLVVEFDVNRLGPHSKGDDTRPKEQIDELKARDWYVNYPRLYPEQFARCEARATTRVADVFRQIESRPLARWTP
jgi:acetoin:2,6-dichlorophenolindophenol oxidoreductase subunit alpha